MKETAAPVPAIAARGLTKRFGDTTAVENLSFDVGWGKVTGFLGANGAGKTTTMRMILGLARPSDGDAEIMGRRYAGLDNPATHVGAVLDGGLFHPRRSGRNALRVIAAAAGIPDARVDDVLELVELTAARRKKVGAYSLGMRQRLALAAALLGDPAILILDEPANGLDPQGIRWLRTFLRDFAAKGNAVFVSSHLLGEVAQIADEVIVIDRGHLIAHAPVTELTAGGEQSLEDVYFKLTEEGTR
jgi:ABC-2 type transport system ATP-binding protein